MKNRACIKISIICLLNATSAYSESASCLTDQIINILKPFQITQDIDKKSLDTLSSSSELNSPDFKPLQENH